MSRKSIKEWSLETKVMTELGLALAAWAAVGVVQYRTLQTLVETDRWVAHTHAVLAELEGTYSAIQQAESGTRGYVATGGEDFLRQREVGLLRASEHLRAVRSMTGDDPRQRHNVARLIPVYNRKLAVMQQLVALRRNQGPVASARLLGQAEGLRLMNKIGELIDQMEAEEKGVLEVRQTASRASARKAGAVAGLGGLFALALVVAAGWITHRDVAAQKQASQNARSLIETSLDALVTISPKGKITDVNEATVKVTGRTRQQLIGTDFSNYFTEPEKARKGYQEVFAQGTVTDYPLTIRHADGRLADVLYNASVYRDVRGSVLGVFAAARDITQRNRAEQALKRAAAYNRNLIETSLDPLVTIAPDGKITDVNSATEDVTGRTRQQLIGTDFSDYFTDPAKARTGYQQAFREGAVKDYELEVRHSEGQVTPVLYNASVYRDEQGQVVGVFAAARDVSAQKQASQYARSLIEASLDPLVTICARGKITDVNEATVKATGVARQQLIGTDFSNYFTEPEKARKGYEQVFARGAVTDYPLTIRHVDGWRIHVLYNASVYRDTQGNVLGVFAAARDVTTQKQYEQALAARAKELARSNADLEQFAYVASHDLQEPLRMVANYTQLLARHYKGKLDADANEFIDYAVDGATRMQSLINDLLTFSRVGRKGKEFEATDCEQVLDTALKNLQGAVTESGASMKRDPLPTVRADDTQLVQLFQNLIGNAIKSKKQEPPRIHISASQNGQEWVFSVRDNGIGFDPQYSDRIFGMFQRLHTRSEYPGSGIGLAICKKIVERHGGKIWAESKPGKGSTFFFTLPSSVQAGIGVRWREDRLERASSSEER